MAEYAQDFQTKSAGLMGYVQTQLSQAVGWSSLPGQLNKIVASSGGYVWGFNTQGQVFRCREPCDGTNWTQVSSPPGINGVPLDIAVDAQNVYVLFNAVAAPAPVTEASVNTWQIPIGDVGMPPGHIQITDGGALVSGQMYGTDFGFGNVAKGLVAGTKYTVTFTDDAGVSASFPLGGAQSGGFYYSISGGSGLVTKFSKSKSVKVSIIPSSAAAPSAASGVSFAIQPVDGSGSWHAQAIPGAAPANPTINITDQFIFVGNQGCSKPCTTSSWVPISGPPGSAGIVAASSGSTYTPVSSAGKTTVYAGTGNGQGGWTPQPGLAGKIPIAVEADSQFLYAQDQGSGNLYRCSAPYTDPDSCKVERAKGNTVSGNHTVTVNPRSYQTYIAAASSGSAGNLYQRLDEGSVDVAPLIDETKQYAGQMDRDVNSLGNATTAQAAALSAAETREEALSAIQQITDLDDKFKETRIKQGNLRSKIVNEKSVMSTRLQALRVVAYTLIAAIIIHISLSFFLSPNIVMAVSVVILLIGVIIAYTYVGVGIGLTFSFVK
jgi:hypothetical protein